MTHIPMLDLRREYEYMKKDIDEAIRKCLDHQKWILGPEVEELEKQAAAYLSVKHAIGASSGTEALVLALRALAITMKGQEYFDKTDRIITTPFTFTATGDAILRAGATPVFVDIDPETYNIDPNKIEEAVRSKELGVIGILPVHLYGLPCRMDDIMAIAADHGLFVVEDCAQAFGASWRGRKVGSIGTCGAFSFFPSKNLGCFGDAGMVSTNDDEIAEIIRMLLKHGGKDKYNVSHIGYNARLDTLQAAILLVKLQYVDEFNMCRRRLARLYIEDLHDITGLLLPGTDLPQEGASGEAEHVFHQFTARVLNARRDPLQQYLHSCGVDAMVYYPAPLHKMAVFDGRSDHARTPEAAEEASRSVLSLPIEPLYGKEEAGVVAQSIRDYYSSKSKVENRK